MNKLLLLIAALTLILSSCESSDFYELDELSINVDVQVSGNRLTINSDIKNSEMYFYEPVSVLLGGSDSFTIEYNGEVITYDKSNHDEYNPTAQFTYQPNIQNVTFTFNRESEQAVIVYTMHALPNVEVTSPLDNSVYLATEDIPYSWEFSDDSIFTTEGAFLNLNSGLSFESKCDQLTNTQTMNAPDTEFIAQFNFSQQTNFSQFSDCTIHFEAIYGFVPATTAANNLDVDKFETLVMNFELTLKDGVSVSIE